MRPGGLSCKNSSQQSYFKYKFRSSGQVSFIASVLQTKKNCQRHMWLTNAVRSIVPGRLHPHEWENTTLASFVKMLAIAAWCERCSECHSEARGSIVCALCSRGSRASSPGGTEIMGKDAAGTPYRGRGQNEYPLFSAEPEKDPVDVTQVGAVRPWRDNLAVD
jgi:hypothetical protein